MQVFTTVSQIQTFLTKQRRKGRTIAFVPTLGALHQGHLTLMKHAGQLADLVVCSIFVNPTQFNEPKDLEKYPRPLGNDIHLLTSAKYQSFSYPLMEKSTPREST